MLEIPGNNSEYFRYRQTLEAKNSEKWRDKNALFIHIRVRQQQNRISHHPRMITLRMEFTSCVCINSAFNVSHPIKDTQEIWQT